MQKEAVYHLPVELDFGFVLFVHQWDQVLIAGVISETQTVFSLV